MIVMLFVIVFTSCRRDHMYAGQIALPPLIEVVLDISKRSYLNWIVLTLEQLW
jgi:hypothetical protein